MEEFVTLERKSAEFRNYLLGQHSAEFRAIPVRSLYINSEAESVTFQIIERAPINIGQALGALVQVMRLDLLTLTVAPALAIWSAVYAERAMVQLNPIDILLGGLALLCLHGAFFARNDFIDHVRGVDRLNEKGGSRVIQRGLLRAVTVRNLYWAFFALGVLLSIPILIHHPIILWTCVAAGAYGIYGYSQLRWSRSGGTLGGLMLFLCTGPFLTWGAHVISIDNVASSVETDGVFLRLGALILGIVFGLITVIYVETRHMISLVVDDEAGLQTLPVKIGFDRAKLVLTSMYVAVAIGALVNFYFWFSWIGLLAGVPFAALASRLAWQMYHVSSPLSSRLQVLLRHALYLHLSLAIVFVIM